MSDARYILIGVDGPCAGMAWEIAGTVKIGREQDIRLADPHASRCHAEVRARAGGVRLRSLTTSNHTRIRWGPFSYIAGPDWTTVRRGARIVIGSGSYRLERRGTGSRREAPHPSSALRVALPLAIAAAMVPVALSGPAWRWLLVVVPLMAAVSLGVAHPGRSRIRGPRRRDQLHEIWLAARDGSAFHTEPVWPRRPRALRTGDPCGTGWAVPHEAGARWLAGFLASFNHPDVLAIDSPWLSTRGEGIRVRFAASPTPGPGTDDVVITWGPHPPTWALPIRPPRYARATREWARLLLPSIRTDGGIPDVVRAVWPTAPAIRRAWARREADLDVAIGQSQGGEVRIDLGVDGPHALVAGTTGAGKSELLTTWVLALAAQNSPECLSLILVDFKGGAAFGPLSGLPHCHAVLTDLDPGATRRALGSLRALLRERERTLAEAGCRDIGEFDRERPGELGRLLVVVDEFRALVDDHPDVLEHVLRLGAQGRSLGIHLILATQRPTGAVGPDIRANMPLRIALRLAEVSDSQDVLGAGVAAQLPRIAGRAVLGPTPLTEFQVAWSGQRTDVTRRVEELARKSGAVPELWLPPLPHRLDVASLPSGCFGVLDLPEELAQHPIQLPDGHLLIAGCPGSGRTTAALAVAAAALSRGFETWIITGDLGVSATPSGAFGGVVHVSQTRLITRALDHVAAAPGRVLAVDDVEMWISHHDDLHGVGTAAELLAAMARMIAAAGSRLVVSGGPEVLHSRWGATFATRIVLSGLERPAATMSGLPRDVVQEAVWSRPGTGYILPEGREMRFAVGCDPVFRSEGDVSAQVFAPLPPSSAVQRQAHCIVIGSTEEGAFSVPETDDIVIVGLGAEARAAAEALEGQRLPGTALILTVTPAEWSTGWTGDLGRVRERATIVVVRPDLVGTPTGLMLASELEPGGPGYAVVVRDGEAKAVRIAMSVEDLGTRVDDVGAGRGSEDEGDRDR